MSLARGGLSSLIGEILVSLGFFYPHLPSAALWLKLVQAWRSAMGVLVFVLVSRPHDIKAQLHSSSFGELQ